MKIHLLKRFFTLLSYSLCIIICMCGVSESEAAKNMVEFRLLLTPAEAHARGCDTVKIDGNTATICTLPYLADRDIENIEVLASINQNNRYLLRFTFNENGRRRLYRLTKKYRARQVAIIIGEKLVKTTAVLPAVFMGDTVVLKWSGTEKEIRSIARSMNKKLPDIFALYVEEMGKYNDAAADSWADVYTRVNSYVGGKQKQFRRDQTLIEAARDEQE